MRFGGIDGGGYHGAMGAEEGRRDESRQGCGDNTLRALSLLQLAGEREWWCRQRGTHCKAAVTCIYMYASAIGKPEQGQKYVSITLTFY